MSRSGQPSPSTEDPQRPGKTDLQPYWNRVSETYAADDPLGAVCYPGAPTWLNRFIAGLQWHTVTRVLETQQLRGTRALDIGCGFGRWTRWLGEHGAEVIGIDSTEGMLEAARRVSTGKVDFQKMSATALEFPDNHFDLVTCITVIQHLKPAEQDVAIGELCRVIRPGGRAVVLDLVDLSDKGKIVYPRPGSDWMSAYTAHGMQMETWHGQEFVPLIRAFRWLAEAASGLLGVGTTAEQEGPSLLEQTSGRGVFKIAYGGLWFIVQVSKPLEFVCQRLLPRHWARHACFVFQKEAS